MYIRFVQEDREVVSLGHFDQRPTAGDLVILDGNPYTVLDQPGRFEKKAIMTGTVVWGLTLQVSKVGQAQEPPCT